MIGADRGQIGPGSSSKETTTVETILGIPVVFYHCTCDRGCKLPVRRTALCEECFNANHNASACQTRKVSTWADGHHAEWHSSRG